MPLHDTTFERELEVYRTEVDTGAQVFYTYQAIYSLARRDALVRRLLESAWLFWRTNLRGLQVEVFMALGRMFDQRSEHNVDTVLRLAQQAPEVFSREELGWRKQRDGSGSFEWLDDYLSRAHEPTPDDWRRLRRHVNKWRMVYQAKIKPVRDKVFAHKEVIEAADINALFAQVDARELQRMFAFLRSLHEALWQLLFNGRKPVLRPEKYSVTRLLDAPSPAIEARAAHERVVQQAQEHLVALARGLDSEVADSRVRPEA
jgi:hypothetical protein